MFQNLRTVISVIIALVSFSSITRAEDCNGVLAATTIRDNSRKNIAIATLALITEDNFDSFKKEYNGGGSVPVEGFPVDLKMSFGEFSEKRKQMRDEHRFDFKLEEVKDLSISFVGDKAIAAWEHCMEGSSGQTLLMRTKSISETDILVSAKWIVGKTAEPGNFSKMILIGGTLVGSMPPEFQSRYTPFQFKREKNAPFSLDIILSNGEGGHVDIPAVTPVLALPQNCFGGTKDGCTFCRIKLEEDLAVFGTGSTKTLTCPGMIPDANIKADVVLNWKISDAKTGKNAIGWAVATAIDRREKDDIHMDAGAEGTNTPTSHKQSIVVVGKSSPSGDASVEISLNRCYWDDATGLFPTDNCSISAQKGSVVEFRVN